VAELTATDGDDWFCRYLPNRLVLGDPAQRDAAMHAIQACIPHGTLLPLAIERVHLGCFEGEATVHAKEKDCSGDDFTYDVELRDSAGVVKEVWEGLQLRKMSAAALATTWPAALVNTYLQRRIAELSGEMSIRVELSVGSPDAKKSRSNRNRYAVVAGDQQLRYRPDGRPEINGVDSVSAAHAGPLTLVAAADAPVACDLELIANPTNDAPALGPQRSGTAELVQRETGDDQQTAEARVWTAAECLIKFGAALDAPLVLDAILDDRWVRFRSGTAAVYSWTTAVRECSERLAVAILVEDGRADV
jgi:enediyne polyketide synthase